ncbi:hypothetical protein [Saccharicrinis aurantiacus]|nr:hypothetical protein [Saccharicrinis aurantiacus]
MKTISNNPSDEVFLPNNFQGMFEVMRGGRKMKTYHSKALSNIN